MGTLPCRCAVFACVAAGVASDRRPTDRAEFLDEEHINARSPFFFSEPRAAVGSRVSESPRRAGAPGYPPPGCRGNGDAARPAGCAAGERHDCGGAAAGGRAARCGGGRARRRRAAAARAGRAAAETPRAGGAPRRRVGARGRRRSRPHVAAERRADRGCRSGRSRGRRRRAAGGLAALAPVCAGTARAAAAAGRLGFGIRTRRRGALAPGAARPGREGARRRERLRWRRSRGGQGPRRPDRRKRGPTIAIGATAAGQRPQAEAADALARGPRGAGAQDRRAADAVDRGPVRATAADGAEKGKDGGHQAGLARQSRKRPVEPAPHAGDAHGPRRTAAPDGALRPLFIRHAPAAPPPRALHRPPRQPALGIASRRVPRHPRRPDARRFAGLRVPAGGRRRARFRPGRPAGQRPPPRGLLRAPRLGTAAAARRGPVRGLWRLGGRAALLPRRRRRLGGIGGRRRARPRSLRRRTGHAVLGQGRRRARGGRAPDRGAPRGPAPRSVGAGRVASQARRAARAEVHPGALAVGSDLGRCDRGGAGGARGRGRRGARGRGGGAGAPGAQRDGRQVGGARAAGHPGPDRRPPRASALGGPRAGGRPLRFDGAHRRFALPPPPAPSPAENGPPPAPGPFPAALLLPRPPLRRAVLRRPPPLPGPLGPRAPFPALVPVPPPGIQPCRARRHLGLHLAPLPSLRLPRLGLAARIALGRPHAAHDPARHPARRIPVPRAGGPDRSRADARPPRAALGRRGARPADGGGVAVGRRAGSGCAGRVLGFRGRAFGGAVAVPGGRGGVPALVRRVGGGGMADALAGELAARVLFVEQLAWLEALRRTCLALVRELEAAGAGRLEVPALPPAGQFDEGWVQGTLWPLAGKFAGGTGVHAALAAAEAELARYSDRSECLQARVAGAAACAVVASGRLPEKVTAVVRAVVSSVKIEASEGLQRASARAAAGLVALLKPEAADKMVRNFGAFLCSDPRGCPPVSEAAHGVLTLARWTKDGAEDAKKANAGARAIEAAKKEEAKEPPSKKQKRAGGKAAAVPGQAEAEAAAALVQAESAEEVHLARSAVTSRGGEMALSEICALYGADVADRVPRVWEIVSAGLEGFAAQGEQLRAAHAQLASDDTFSQTVVNSVFALGKLVGHFSGAALERALALLPAVSRLLATPRPAVRFACSECLAMFAEHATVRTLLHVISDVLPLLGDTTSDVARQAGAEAVYHIVDRMQLKVLPYLIFLVIPVLKRISDPEPGVRFLCTHNFATLVKLMPLEQGAPDPEGLDPELIRQKKEERRFIGQLIGTEQVEDFEIPAGIIKAELRRYQQEGVNWLGFLGRYGMHGILCDDMGLGKTLQTISIVASNHYLRAQRFKETGAADSKPIPTLVVCPTTIVGHWFYEIRNFTEVLNPIMYAGQPAVRAKLRPKLLQHDVVITSYECLRNDLQELGKITWNYVVLDEGHLIRNAKTKITQAVKSLISTHRLILSGTPIQNNALELWSLFDFLMPGFLGTEKQFNEKYSKPILASRDAKASTKEQEAGTLALDALHRQVLPFLLRRMKEDVLQDLPPKIIQDYYSDLSEIQRTLYEDFSRSRAKNEVYEDVSGKGGKGSGGTHVFQALQYLRKLVNHPALVLTPQHPEHGKVTSMLAKSNSSLRDLQHAPKLLALQELLLDCGIGTGGATPAGEDASNLAVAGHRALIFCQLKPMLDIIENDLFKAHMPDVTYMRLDGSVDATKRQELVRKFNDDPGIDVLLLTTHVGGLGLNLTGADTVIFVEHDWNPMKDLQAMDRAHRIGQKRKVNVYRLITRNTLEEKIMGLQRFKLNIASSIVNEENVGLKSMLSDSEQLLDLFNIGEAKEPAKKDGDAKMTQKEILESMDKWDDEQRFEEQYETADFLATLR